MTKELTDKVKEKILDELVDFELLKEIQKKKNSKITFGLKNLPIAFGGAKSQRGVKNENLFNIYNYAEKMISEYGQIKYMSFYGSKSHDLLKEYLTKKELI